MSLILNNENITMMKANNIDNKNSNEFKSDNYEEYNYYKLPNPYQDENDEFIFNDKEEYTNYAWNYKDLKFINPNLSQYERRKQRISLTKIIDENVLFLFLRSLLLTALENELNNTEEENFYVYNPYNQISNLNLNLSMDDFSSKSHLKKIGIRTKLDIHSVNIILSCFYVLYSQFKKTSDEIIFEETYRKDVLMQDSSFELSKYYDRVKTNYPEMISKLTSFTNQCLDLIPFSDRQLQFDVWKLTYNNHSKKITINETFDTSEFLTIEGLLSKYDEVWFAKHQSGELDVSIAKSVTKVIEDASNYVEELVLGDTSSLDTKVHGVKVDETEPEKLSFFDRLEVEASKPVVKDESVVNPIIKDTELDNKSFETMDIMSAPSTQMAAKKSSSFGFIDSLISRMSFSFGKSKQA